MIRQLGLYFNTLRHLRPSQVANRIWRAVYRPSATRVPALPLRKLVAVPTEWINKSSSYVDDQQMRFLNRVRSIEGSEVWSDPSVPRLWLYQLHYFDDLNAAGGVGRLQWQRSLIRRWINENPPGFGIGWQPYPVSLRIGNWIKWHLSTGLLDSEDIANLATQVNWLSKHLEFHLLGNHLLENLRALALAGLFFESKQSDIWLSKGLEGLQKQLRDQLLPDGGHIERSPMYQAILIDGLLDLVNLLRSYDHGNAKWLTEACERMLEWLMAMCHPDGEISQFNDAALGFAPAPRDLVRYAHHLGVKCNGVQGTAIHLKHSGFMRICQRDVVMLLDIGALGPEYLSAHGHADTFTFELSRGSQRVFVNGGTSTYEEGSRRDSERATSAHNTVEIDGENSSETWASFRVARRAYVHDLRISKVGEHVCVMGWHDGYRRLRGAPVHERCWNVGPQHMTIDDRIVSRSTHRVRSFLHLHPGLTAEPVEQGFTICDGRGRKLAIVRCDQRLQATVEQYLQHPQFGVGLDSSRIVASGRTTPEMVLHTSIEFPAE